MTLDLKNQGKSGVLSDEVEMAERANRKVRNLSCLLHLPLLDESGLIPALHWFVEGFKKRSSVRISLDANQGIFLVSRKKSRPAIYRIVRESVSNVYRHSGSPDSRIEIEQQRDRVLIRVRDFGKGIDLNLSGSQPLSVRVGIAGIRERLKLGGDLKITRVEPGTLVEATMPLFQGANDVRATS